MFHPFDWQSVFTTQEEAEAQALASLLEARGIIARQGRALDEITVMVDSRDYEQALAVLHEDELEPQ